MDGVIQAITPGLHLRSFLEATPNLTLGFLRKTFRSHHGEKDATSLYQELAACHQKGNETPMAFGITKRRNHPEPSKTNQSQPKPALSYLGQHF